MTKTWGYIKTKLRGPSNSCRANSDASRQYNIRSESNYWHRRLSGINRTAVAKPRIVSVSLITSYDLHRGHVPQSRRFPEYRNADSPGAKHRERDYTTREHNAILMDMFSYFLRLTPFVFLSPTISKTTSCFKCAIKTQKKTNWPNFLNFVRRGVVK